MSDPAKYRTKDEVTKYRQERDPIEQVKARLIESGAQSEESLKAIENDIRAIVTEAAEFATNDPEPDASELWTDITISA
jgi:pyruvate dehydrogenase E1 component alpha subunit